MKLSNKYSNLNKKEKCLILIVILATLFRIYLAIKMPLYLQAGADFDDFLMINYAKSMLQGNWLGAFGAKTLAKGVSYPIFIVLTYILGIPYSLGIILLYILAIMLFIKVIKKFINNKYYLLSIYLLLLYSPVMFHIENVQKIYRGGVIVSLSLIVISAMIGIFNSNKDNIKTLLKYSLIASISLPFFYYLKEDSIWIVPFVICAIAISLLTLKSKDLKIKQINQRVFLIVLPIISLLASKFIYCGINYAYYGEFSITDRTGTYFKEVIADIIKIDEKNEIEDVWITKDMMYKAIDASPTLNTIKKEIDNMYETSWAVKENGEIEGDIIYWTFKEAVADAGIYKKGGKKLNLFYEKIDNELKKAYKNGKLKEDKDKKIYLSSIAKGFTIEELLEYYPKTTLESIDMLITYNQNETTVYSATGPIDRVGLMDHLTNSETVWPDDIQSFKKPHYIIVNIINKIVKVYQVLGYPMFILGIIGLIILTIDVLKKLKRKDNEYFYLWLIMLGLIGTCAALLFGVLWFCSCFNGSIMRHVYNYTCGMIPLIQILEITGIYFLIRSIYILRKTKE